MKTMLEKQNFVAEILPELAATKTMLVFVDDQGREGDPVPFYQEPSGALIPLQTAFRRAEIQAALSANQIRRRAAAIVEEVNRIAVKQGFQLIKGEGYYYWISGVTPLKDGILLSNDLSTYTAAELLQDLQGRIEKEKI